MTSCECSQTGAKTSVSLGIVGSRAAAKFDACQFRGRTTLEMCAWYTLQGA